MPECQACGKIRHEGALKRIKVWEGEKFSMRLFCAECAQLPHGDLPPPLAPWSQRTFGTGPAAPLGCLALFLAPFVAGGFFLLSQCSGSAVPTASGGHLCPMYDVISLFRERARRRRKNWIWESGNTGRCDDASAGGKAA